MSNLKLYTIDILHPWCRLKSIIYLHKLVALPFVVTLSLHHDVYANNFKTKRNGHGFPHPRQGTGRAVGRCMRNPGGQTETGVLHYSEATRAPADTPTTTSCRSMQPAMDDDDAE